MDHSRNGLTFVSGEKTVKKLSAESRVALDQLPKASVTLVDMVNHPPHYTFGKYEVIDVIEDWGLNYHRGNAIKYLARAGKKNENVVEDLKKAIFYINREVDQILREQHDTIAKEGK
jgi:hypothetical protein